MPVTIKTAPTFNNPKYRMFAPEVKLTKQLIGPVVAYVREHFNVPFNIQFNIRCIRDRRGEFTSGRTVMKTAYRRDADADGQIKLALQGIDLDPRGKCAKGTKYNMIETIIHELVHANQYLEGRLQASANFKYSFFEGVEQKNASGAHTHQQYLDLPWEVEARKIAKKLTLSFLEKQK